MKHKQTQSKARAIIINKYATFALATGVIFIVAILFIYGYIETTKATTDKIDTQKLAQRTPGTPQFSFTGATNWRQGPTDHVSMALFHKSDNGCFVSVEYKQGSIDPQLKLDSLIEKQTKDGFKVESIGSKDITMRTGDEVKKFQLSQYHASSGDAENSIKGGQEFAFIPLDKGYIKVQGYCDVTKDLPTTITALEAIKFNQID